MKEKGASEKERGFGSGVDRLSSEAFEVEVLVEGVEQVVWAVVQYSRGVTAKC